MLGEDNGNSGIRKADIAIMYEDQTVIRSINTSITNDSFRINDECHIVITVYDNAGNSLLKSYAFNKSDSTPPTAPEIRLVPNVQPDESTKGYGKLSGYHKFRRGFGRIGNKARQHGLFA